MMITILYIASVYLLITSFVLIRNRFEFKALADSNIDLNTKSPKVSICIPARNEESVIERCVQSALNQDYPNFEVLVLNDNSTDRTTEILDSLSKENKKLNQLKGKEKPNDWLGKPWACQQLGETAVGDYLIFIDADVWLEQNTLKKAVSQLQRYDSITVWPEQKLYSFWEKMTVPLIYFALLSLLPTLYVRQYPKWLPISLKPKVGPLFAAACGQFIAFRRETYFEIGAHASVKNDIVEDVELAKNIKKKGFSLSMFHGVNEVYCRMYTSHNEIWNGLRKNFFVGFGKNVPFFLLMATIHIIVFVLPIFILVQGVIYSNTYLTYYSILVLCIILFQRILFNSWLKFPTSSSFLHPFSVIWYQILGIRCLIDHFSGQKVSWKGRKI